MCTTRISIKLAICLMLATFSLPMQANDTSDPRASDIVGDQAVHGLLHTLITTALEHDPQLRTAYKEFLADQEETALARSRFLPEVSFSAGYRYEDSDNIYTDPDSGFYDPNMERSSGRLGDDYLRLNVSQRLFDWKIVGESRRARAYVSESELRYTQAQQQLVLRIGEAFLDALYRAQQVHLSENRLEALEFKYSQVRRQHELGIGDRLDMLEVQAHRDMASADLVQAQSLLRDARTRVESITGTPLDIPSAWLEAAHLVEPFPQSSELDLWIEQVTNNLEYRISQLRTEQTRASLSSAKAERYPTINLSLSYEERSSDDPFRERNDKVASLDLSVPLYRGGWTSAQVRRNSAKLQANMARVDATIDEATQQIKIAHARVASLAERLRALSQSRQSSELYLQAAERGEVLNLRSQVEVLDARARLVDVQLQLAEALNQYLQADLELHYHIGSLMPERMRDYDTLFTSAVQRHRGSSRPSTLIE